jgi:pimeloyl-ACP methyl ester carboxylesterase
MWLNENRGTEPMKRILICLALLALAGCIAIGDPDKPIPTLTFSAPGAPSAAAERTLIVVLPGFGADAQDMKAHGVQNTIQDVWPEADVVLTSATIAYYRGSLLVDRLNDEIVVPAKRAGYRHVWLVAASMGAMGAILYDYKYPGTVSGVVLFAPWLGDKSLLEEIRNAGGPQAWNPGPVAPEITSDTYQRLMWKTVKEWSARPELARRVWLATGDVDRLMPASRLLAEALPRDHFFELKGGHQWDTWLIGGKTVFSTVRNTNL